MSGRRRVFLDLLGERDDSKAVVTTRYGMVRMFDPARDDRRWIVGHIIEGPTPYVATLDEA